MFWRSKQRSSFDDTIRVQFPLPVEPIYQAIIAIEEYPRWQRSIVDTSVLQRDPAGRPLEAQFELDAMIRTVRYTLRYTYDNPPFHVSWHSESGSDIGRIEGSYRLTPSQDGSSTEVALRMVIHPGIPVPRHIRTVLEQTGMHQALRDLRNHAEDMAQRA